MSEPQPVVDFDFHGKALDTIFDDYQLMLESKPVGHSSKYGGFWYITKSEDIFQAEQDPDTWSVAPGMMMPPMGTEMPLIPIDIDPPEHGLFRKLLLPMFTPMEIKKLEPGMHATAQELAEQVRTAFATDPVVDVSTRFARPYPTIIFSRLAGYPEDDWPMFDRWIDEIIYDRTKSPEKAQAAGDELIAYVTRLVDHGRAGNAQGGIMGALLQKTVNGRPLTDEELLSYGYLLFLAGLDTTAWALRSSLWYLARNQEAQRLLRAEPERIPDAVEEFLRTLSPVQAMARTAKRDTVVRGQKIKAGERVALVFGAGNRDPEIYENPDDIDVTRENNRHLAFGGGIHRCLGSNLGRKELVIALTHFLATVADFEPAAEEPWHGVGSLRLRLSGGE
ncbi:cytochrome P450 [Micromonospora radicis]|uniref:Cytochrome P450 n=1 Tax=Micromonospora radicis TaxID=1894971 RepID=A0A418MUL1_9ACTN|nr:cytochrome P450 [Micromonospora radicis]RIV37959.1 cytochrome P450 [Micromonospora radicis]